MKNTLFFAVDNYGNKLAGCLAGDRFKARMKLNAKLGHPIRTQIKHFRIMTKAQFNTYGS